MICDIIRHNRNLFKTEASMKKIRYAIVGSGWRSLFFIRIAKALPEQFEVTGILVRSDEKKERFEKEYGIFATTSQDELLETKPDFVVEAVSRRDNAKVCIELMKKGAAVLAETPPADTIEDLGEIWRVSEEMGGKVQVAEQYVLYPMYDARLRIAREGYLGEIQNASLSALHEYHGISILRAFLGVGLENVSVTAKNYSWPIAVTQNRDGVLQRGNVSGNGRVRAEFVFESGKIGFYDFCGIQYNSHIRSRHLNVQGVRGEIDDNHVYYLDEDNYPISETLTPVVDQIHPGIASIGFAGKTVYRNPFDTNVLTEDETAIARHLVGMAEYIESGRELYPLADAMQDAYLTIILKKAIESGETVTSADQIWKK